MSIFSHLDVLILLYFVFTESLIFVSNHTRDSTRTASPRNTKELPIYKQKITATPEMIARIAKTTTAERASESASSTSDIYSTTIVPRTSTVTGIKDDASETQTTSSLPKMTGMTQDGQNLQTE